MRAITEIPAKTPRPIGRTDNFFPGKPVFAASAPTAVPLAVVEEAEAELADAVATFSGEAVVDWTSDDAEVVCALELVGTDDGTLLTRDETEEVTVDTGLEVPRLELDVEDAEDTEEEEPNTDAEVAAEVRGRETVVDPDDVGAAELAGVESVEAELSVAAELAEAEVTGVVLEELRAVLVEEEPLVAEAVGAEEVPETREVEETEVKEEVLVAPDAMVDPVDEVLDEIDEVLVVESSWTLQVRTSWTAGCPLLSVMGVRTIVHVSVTGPLAVIRVVTVVSVRLPFCWRGCRGRACAGVTSSREDNAMRKAS